MAGGNKDAYKKVLRAMKTHIFPRIRSGAYGDPATLSQTDYLRDPPILVSVSTAIRRRHLTNLPLVRPTGREPIQLTFIRRHYVPLPRIKQHVNYRTLDGTWLATPQDANLLANQCCSSRESIGIGHAKHSANPPTGDVGRSHGQFQWP